MRGRLGSADAHAKTTCSRGKSSVRPVAGTTALTAPRRDCARLSDSARWCREDRPVDESGVSGCPDLHHAVRPRRHLPGIRGSRHSGVSLNSLGVFPQAPPRGAADPAARRAIDVVDADVVLTSSSGWAHGFRTSGRKLVYCHSPARWLYLRDKYLGEDSGLLKRALGSPRRRGTSALGPSAAVCDRYLAVSTGRSRAASPTPTASRPMCFPPGGDVAQTGAAEPDPEVLQWWPTRRTDPDEPSTCACRGCCRTRTSTPSSRAFAGRDRRLVVVGRGPEAERMRRLKTPNVLMLSDLTDGQMAWLYQHCRALDRGELRGLRPDPDRGGRLGPAQRRAALGRIPRHRPRGHQRYVLRRAGPRAIAEALDRFEATRSIPTRSAGTSSSSPRSGSPNAVRSGRRVGARQGDDFASPPAPRILPTRPAFAGGIRLDLRTERVLRRPSGRWWRRGERGSSAGNP